LAAIGDRYRASVRAEQTKILDEFVAVTGYHRKHAIRLLRPKLEPTGVLPRRVHRHYGEEVREALIALWEASDRLCSKRLKPIIPVLLPALERHGQLAIDEAIRTLVLTISPATIDRLLSEVRLVARGGRRRRAGFSSAVRRTVPVRTFGDWNDPPPGFVEVDFVAHSGTSAAGSFVQTMVLTDVATGWTECLPLVARNGALVIEALTAAMALFPFPLRGVDFDNDGLFMNEPVVTWCRQKGLEVTRSHAPTGRTIRPGSSIRTAPLCAASSATVGWRDLPRRTPWPDSMPPLACTRTCSSRCSSLSKRPGSARASSSATTRRSFRRIESWRSLPSTMRARRSCGSCKPSPTRSS
jgi:hypothetical protein